MAGESLVVMSKVKKYIKDNSDMNTAGNVVDVLSDKIRAMCDHAMECAKADKRKTVKDRDFDFTFSFQSGGGDDE